MDVVEAVKNGLANFTWSEIINEKDGIRMTFSVFSDALKIVHVEPDTGEAVQVRVMVTSVEAQQIADLLGCMCTTPLVEDLIARQAEVTIKPITQIDGNICAVSTDTRHSELVDAELAKVENYEDGMLINTVGKSWVLVNKLAHPEQLKFGIHQAYNYGWIHPSAVYWSVTMLKCWQTVGGAHNDEHEDPSQTCRLMGKWVKVEHLETGEEYYVEVETAGPDPELGKLISHEGTLQVFRQPSVPEPEEKVIVLPEVIVYGTPPTTPTLRELKPLKV